MIGFAQRILRPHAVGDVSTDRLDFQEPALRVENSLIAPANPINVAAESNSVFNPPGGLAENQGVQMAVYRLGIRTVYRQRYLLPDQLFPGTVI